MKNSPYDGALIFLQLELGKLFKDGIISEEEYNEGLENLDTLSPSSLMLVYKFQKRITND